MSLNKVMLIGNVGKEPDVRYLDNGVAVASLTLATTERGYRLLTFYPNFYRDYSRSGQNRALTPLHKFRLFLGLKQ